MSLLGPSVVGQPQSYRVCARDGTMCGVGPAVFQKKTPNHTFFPATVANFRCTSSHASVFKMNEKYGVMFSKITLQPIKKKAQNQHQHSNHSTTNPWWNILQLCSKSRLWSFVRIWGFISHGDLCGCYISRLDCRRRGVSLNRQPGRRGSNFGTKRYKNFWPKNHTQKQARMAHFRGNLGGAQRILGMEMIFDSNRRRRGQKWTIPYEKLRFLVNTHKFHVLHRMAPCSGGGGIWPIQTRGGGGGFIFGG